MSEAPPYIGPDAIAALGVRAAADAIEATLAAGFDPERQPTRERIQMGEGELLVMPGTTSGCAIIKAVTVGGGGPRIQGLCILFDSQTLTPTAVIDGRMLTVLRTAALSALAVRRLAVRDASRLLVFGDGPQGHAHVEAVRAVRPIDHVRVFGRADLDRDAEVAEADIICCCTTAAEPLFDGGLVADHACVVAVGSHLPDARETDDRLSSRSTVVVESRAAALLEAGDVIAAMRSGALVSERILTLSQLIAEGVMPGEGPRLFKSVGMAWEDAVVAAAVLQAVELVA